MKFTGDELARELRKIDRWVRIGNVALRTETLRLMDGVLQTLMDNQDLLDRAAPMMEDGSLLAAIKDLLGDGK